MLFEGHPDCQPGITPDPVASLELADHCRAGMAFLLDHGFDNLALAQMRADDPVANVC